MPCEICGAENVPIYPTLMDGTMLRACEPCGGKRPLSAPAFFSPAFHPRSPGAKLNTKPRYSLDEGLDIAADLGKQVAKKREEMGLDRTQLAAMLKIKESVLHKIEHGSLQPDDALLRILEKTLHLNFRTKNNINEPNTDKPTHHSPSHDSHLTLSDILEQQLAKEKSPSKKKAKNNG